MRRKKNKDENKMDESWLLPYSDMMTLLLALFIVLFAMSQVDAVKFNKLSHVLKGEFTGGEGILDHGEGPMDVPVEIPDKPEEDHAEDTNDKDLDQGVDKELKGKKELNGLQDIQYKINTYIKENKLADVFGTKLTDEGLLITIMNDVTFKSGSATVNQNGEKIAKELSNLLDTDPPRQVVISGHTDNRPIHNANFSSNWELSVMRAIGFMKIILQDTNLDPSKFSAKGFGENHPIAPNTNKKNMAKNRRVEVLVLPNYSIKNAGEHK